MLRVNLKFQISNLKWFYPIWVLVLIASAGRAQDKSPVRPWQACELSGGMALTELPNPYVDTLPDSGEPYALVAFTGVDGAAQGMRAAVRAFWDGGRNFNIRFAPPAPGRWDYATRPSDPIRMKGTLTCAEWTAEEIKANPLRRGFLRVASEGPRAGRRFVHADGSPFFWLGDTWWDWSKPGIQFETFQKLVDNRAAKGFTIGQLRFNSRAMLNRDKTEPNLDEIRRVEKMIEYANSRGITVWIMPWWGGEDLKRTGPEKIRRWWRYVMQRLGAYHVIWVLAGEYNMDGYSGLGLDFWRDLAGMIKREDPYGHLVSAHPTPPTWDRGMPAPQWSTAEVPEMHAALDYDQSQSGHGRPSNEMIPSIVSEACAVKPPKPIVVTEPWYEFTSATVPAADIRFAAWSAVLSGAAGHSYGGGNVWWANVPEAPQGGTTWPLDDPSANTLDYPGAQSLAVMARLLRENEWWRLEPHPELVADTASRYCAAEPGNKYLVYLRWGGVVKVDLRPSAATDKFEATWIEAATGNIVGKPSGVGGGAAHSFRAPRGFPGNTQPPADWLLIIGKK